MGIAEGILLGVICFVVVYLVCLLVRPSEEASPWSRTWVPPSIKRRIKACIRKIRD